MVGSAALTGAWDYDISTCQWTLLSQMASKLGIDSPLTNAYISDKRSLRRRVSVGAGITLDDAKKCITALLFGAVVQHSEKAMRWHPGDLVKGIGAPAALRLCEQADFMALYDEIGRVGDAVVKAWPRQNGRLFNDLGIQHRSGSELAHLLQGAEAAVLRAVVMQQQGNILLCVHDGWVAQERLDVDALVGPIETESGYRVGIEEDELVAPGRDRIKHKLDEFEAFSEGELQIECPFAVAQGDPAPLVDPVISREDRPGAGRLQFTPSDEAGLWTSHPHPDVPVRGRLAYVSPRPSWNLPPGSTADSVDRKRVEAAALSATKREAVAAQLPE